MTHPHTVRYSDVYAVTDGFDTVAKSAEIAANLTMYPVGGITLAEPDYPDYFNSVMEAHSEEHLDNIFNWKGLSGAPASQAGLDSVLASTEGMAHAAFDVAAGHKRAGSLSAGMHHATADYGMGFCTLNGLAVAADVLRSCGMERIVIVDLDAHSGGGTWSIVQHWPEVGQVDVYVDAFDTHDPKVSTGLGASSSPVRHRSRYLSTIERELRLWAVRYGSPQAVIYNAGMDPHQDSAIGGLPGITSDTLRARDRLVFDWADSHGAGVVWGLAGGYIGENLTMEGLVNLHRITAEEAAR